MVLDHCYNVSLQNCSVLTVDFHHNPPPFDFLPTQMLKERCKAVTGAGTRAHPRSLFVYRLAGTAVLTDSVC